MASCCQRYSHFNSQTGALPWKPSKEKRFQVDDLFVCLPRDATSILSAFVERVFRPTNSSSCHPERGQVIKGRPPIALSLPKSWTEDPRRDTEEATRRFTRALSPTGRLFYRWQLSIDRLPERHGIWSGNLHVKRKP